MTATVTTFLGFPRSVNESAKGFKTLLYRLATTAGIYNIVLSFLDPILEIFPFPRTDDPDCFTHGFKPAKALKLLAFLKYLRSGRYAKRPKAVFSPMPSIDMSISKASSS